MVAEAVPSVLKGLKDTVDQSHKAGLFFFTFGDANNAVEHYSAQRAAGVDAIILDDTARLAKVGMCVMVALIPAVSCLDWGGAPKRLDTPPQTFKKSS